MHTVVTRSRFLVLATLLLVPHASSQSPSEEPERGLRVKKEGTFDGLTLLSPLNSDHVYLLDMDGEIVHDWTTTHAPGGGCYFQGDGSILRCARLDDTPRFHGGGISGLLERIDWDGNVVWSYELASDERSQHHDLRLLPNGNMLTICWEYLPPEEAVRLGRDPKMVGPEGLWPDVLLEIHPTLPSGGEIAWEWHVWDHLVQDFAPEQAGYGSVRDHPERIDINGDHRDAPPPSAEDLERQADSRSRCARSAMRAERTTRRTRRTRRTRKRRTTSTGSTPTASTISPTRSRILSTPHLGEVDHR
jgi:hypothetical protein